MKRPTLRQFSAAMIRGEEPPPEIDDADAIRQRERARALLADAAKSMKRIDGEKS